MIFVLLDDYSIGEIFSMLFLKDHQSLARTCKTLHAISKRCFNLSVFKRNLQSYLIKTMFRLHNRSDIPGNIERQYRINFMLKAYKQVISGCQYMRIVPITNTQHPYDSDEAVIDKLIRKSLGSNQNNGLAFLCNVGFHSRIVLNFWYVFDLGNGAYVYLCNVKHPEFEVERRESRCDVVIGIYYEEEKDPAFYCCNVSKFDWFVSELSSSEFSTSSDVLAPICSHLKKLFSDNSTRNNITPELLQRFTLSNYYQHLRHLETILKDAHLDHISNTHEANGRCNFKGNSPTENVEQVDQNVQTTVNLNTADSIITNTEKEISMFKSASSRNIQSIFNKDADMNDLSKLSDNLKYYCNFCEDENEDESFIDSLACFVRVCTKTLSVFDYGELLPYKPVVNVLLENVMLDEKVLEQNREVVCISLKSKRLNRIKVTVEQKRSTCFYQFEFNNELLFSLRKVDDYVISPGREVATETRNLLLREFEEFLMCNFDDELTRSMPIVSLAFIFTFLDILFLQPLCEIATVRETFFNVW